MNNKNIVFNPELLLEKLEGDKELACELLEAFSEDAPMRMAALEQAVIDGDGEAACEAAHSLKGMCGVLRVQPLVNLALSMERAGRDDNIEKVQSALGTFKLTLDAALEQVRIYLDA